MSQVSGKQSVGRRENQEDAFKIVFQEDNNAGSDLLMLLSDGMGGHAGGEVASRLVCQVFAEHFIDKSRQTRPRPRLQESLAVANRALASRIKSSPELRGMGCTLIAALKMGERLVWISVGDSILFLLRDGRMQRLNADHSVFGELMELVRAGKMSLQEARAHPKRNALRSAILGGKIAMEDINSIELRKGDLIVLASDGLETLSDAEIAAILTRVERPDVRAVASDLLNAVEAKAEPSQDNTSVIVYQHSGGDTTSRGGVTQWGLEDTPARRAAGLKIGLVIGLVGAIIAILLIGFMLLNATPDEPAVPEDSTPQSETQSSGSTQSGRVIEGNVDESQTQGSPIPDDSNDGEIQSEEQHDRSILVPENIDADTFEAMD